MKYLNITFLVLLFLLDSSHGFGRETASILIKVNDKNVLEKEATIRISTYTDLYFYEHSLSDNTFEKRINRDSELFTVEVPSEIAFLMIELIIEGEKKYFRFPDNVFLLEPSDKLEFVFQNGKVDLKGKGNEKNKIKIELNQIEIHKNTSQLQEYITNKNYAGYLDERKKQALALGNKRITYLENNKHRLSSSAYDLLLDDCNADTENSVVIFLASLMEGSFRREFRPYLMPFFYRYFDDEKQMTFEKYTGKSYEFIGFLNDKAELEVRLADWKDTPEYQFLSFEKYYWNLHNTFKGRLRDRLIFHAYSKRGAREPGGEKLIEGAIASVNDTTALKGLRAYKEKFYDRKPVYPFVLVDTIGKKYTPEDFKGKVVILDFWFLGCTGCIQLSKDLKTIKAALKSESVVFVTVNVDPSKERWLKGIESGNYTGESIDLQVDGQGVNNPFIRYYGFMGFPRLMIIDEDGDLISANPPRPGTTKTSKEFESLIRSYL